MLGSCCCEILTVIGPVVLSKYLAFQMSRSIQLEMAFLQTANAVNGMYSYALNTRLHVLQCGL